MKTTIKYLDNKGVEDGIRFFVSKQESKRLFAKIVEILDDKKTLGRNKILNK